MNQQISILKCRGGLDALLEERLLQLQRGFEEIIPWDRIYCSLCRCFSIKKQRVREILYFVAESGLIEICKRGVKLHY